MIWIKTSDKLPEVDGRVLVIEHNEVKILSYNDYHQCWDDEDMDDFHCSLEKIEYWMPLPKTFKELEEDAFLEIDRMDLCIKEFDKSGEFKLGDTVTHPEIYNGNERFIVVGIRADELEIQGDWSGGTNCVNDKSWYKIDGMKLEFRPIKNVTK